MSRLASPEVHRWLQEYRDTHADLLDQDPEFQRWLDEEYVPIGGGWQY
jgi:hypothetical protein